jgi:hypothetical protein
MANRQFLQLAHKFEPEKHCIAGWFWSEKCDGMRAFWDGGVSRGVPASEVPWANVEKHGRFVNQVIATGLYSRYGQVIRAPDWWLNFLPKAPFDGELYAGRGKFQFVTSTVKDHVGTDDWNNIKFVAFGMPSYQQVMQNGKINETNFKKMMNLQQNMQFIEKQIVKNGPVYQPAEDRMFQDSYQIMQNRFNVNNHAFTIHRQERLSYSQDEALRQVEDICTRLSELGAEGIMLQKPETIWVPVRSHNTLKVKKLEDAEGIVVGCTTGRKTGKGSKLLGKMGAVILMFNGKKFELSGFTDEERELECATYNNGVPYATNEAVRQWAEIHQGEVCPVWIQPKHFKLGTQITFKYRELSDDGIPKEARYHRIRSQE